MKFSLFSSTMVGLDVQPDVMRLVKIRKTWRKLIVECVAYAALPQGVISHNKVKDWDGLQSAVTELVHSNNLRGEQAAIGLPGQLANMQRLLLPGDLGEQEIETEVCRQLEQESSDAATVNVDFTILPAAGNGFCEVATVTVEKSYLSRFIQCLGAAGLKTKIADVDSYALARSMVFAAKQLFDSGTGILIIFSWVAERAILTACAGKRILFHEFWDVTGGAESVRYVQARIIAYLERKQIKPVALAICAEEEYTAALEGLAWDYPLYFPQIFSSMKVADSIDQEQLYSVSPAYAIATGLAMRDAS